SSLMPNWDYVGFYCGKEDLVMVFSVMVKVFQRSYHRGRRIERQPHPFWGYLLSGALPFRGFYFAGG
ncbi:MAG: hypothetical protein RRX94_06240, partial [Raoultibacter sp.]